MRDGAKMRINNYFDELGNVRLGNGKPVIVEDKGSVCARQSVLVEL